MWSSPANCSADAPDASDRARKDRAATRAAGPRTPPRSRRPPSRDARRSDRSRHDRDLRLGQPGAERFEPRPWAIDVAFPRDQERGTTERAELRRDGDGRDVDIPGVERQTDERQARDAFVRDRLSERDGRPEGPSADEGRALRFLADPPYRGLDVLDLGVPSRVGPGAPHRPPEVEREDDESTRSELVAERPQDRMILAPAVAGVRVTHHG